MTLAEMLDMAMRESGFVAEGQYASNTSENALQVFNIANRAARDIADFQWPELVSTQTLTLTTATQYDLPDDFREFVPDTATATGRLDTLDFPTDPAYWSYLKSHTGGSGIRYRVRRIGTKLEFHNPQAGESVRIEYISDHPVLGADGTTTKPRFTADTDTWRLDDDLLIAGFKWRFRQLKGFQDWPALRQEADAAFRKQIAQSRGSQTVHMGETNDGPTGEPYTDLWVD